MIELTDWTADLIVRALDEERARCYRTRTHRDLRGPDHAKSRKTLLRREKELELAISGLNAERGIVRASAVQDG